MTLEDLYSTSQWSSLQEQLSGLYPEWDISLFDLLSAVMAGEGKEAVRGLFTQAAAMLTGEGRSLKTMITTLVILILVSAVFTVFKDAFTYAQIADIAFYINYLIMIILFINLFQQTLEMGEDTLERIEEFMRIFFPAYWMTVGISSGVSSGLVYYQLGSLAIYLVELILKNILLPCCSAYMLFVMLNGLWGEERLELLLELWKKGMKLALRAILGLLTGASLIQSIITPVIDKLKVETAYQTVEAIPGVGNAAQGVLRLWMGSAVLIKNSVGAVSCILLLLLTLVPLLKIALTGGLLKLTAAVLGMVGDKRLIHCTNSVGDGILLLLQITSYAVLFFLVLVAITAYTTGGGM